MLDRPASAKLSAYFTRIEYGGSTRVAEETLFPIAAGQSWRVPFENIDIHLDRGIDLGIEALFAKLVGRRRGGYCYELNGILQYILTSLGFDVTALAGRTRLRGATTLPKTHMLLLVTLAGRPWLVDAGFGAYGLDTCLPLDAENVTRHGGDAYRIVRGGAPIYSLQS